MDPMSSGPLRNADFLKFLFGWDDKSVETHLQTATRHGIWMSREKNASHRGECDDS